MRIDLIKWPRSCAENMECKPTSLWNEGLEGNDNTFSKSPINHGSTHRLDHPIPPLKHACTLLSMVKQSIHFGNMSLMALMLMVAQHATSRVFWDVDQPVNRIHAVWICKGNLINAISSITLSLQHGNLMVIV